jgi:alkanesulfonate monooxygenase SsuD/methylene tetrahydromethanopterin reductase-like flavin-dependent oxidoreductase (luciferase family)
MVAIIGGEPRRFRPLIDLDREAGRRAGHLPERPTVGLHSVGFLADTTDEAAGIFFSGYAHTISEIGKERGWPPATRAQFDAVRGPTGRLLVGDAKTVAPVRFEEMRRHSVVMLTRTSPRTPFLDNIFSI